MEIGRGERGGKPERRGTAKPAPAAGSRPRLDKDAQVTLDLLENAHDPDGDTLTVIILTAPRHGKLVANPDGTYTYIPDEGYLGEDSFTYKVNDGKLDSNIATVTLVVALAEESAENNGTEHPGKSATITIQSKLAYASAIPKNDPYILLNKGKSETKPETPR
ncbi:MAG: cadherin-like domain-containing protein, partial [Candidatus Accumulibacter sp.]|nr:cadherin-like domain-containing protein [Accumulibacter sp.]